MAKARAKVRSGTTLWSIIWNVWTVCFWSAVYVGEFTGAFLILKGWFNPETAGEEWSLGIVAILVALLFTAVLEWGFDNFKNWAETVEISWPGD